MDLAGEVRTSGLPYHGHGPLAAAVQKLWWRHAIQPTVVAVLLQRIKKWVVLKDHVNSTFCSHVSEVV